MPFTTVFTSIPNGDIDVDSPITTGLMTAYRNNDQYLLEYIGGGAGGGFTPAAAHNHDGVNSANIQGQIISSAYAQNTTGGSFVSGWQTLISLPSVTIAAGQALIVDANYAGAIAQRVFAGKPVLPVNFRLILGAVNQPLLEMSVNEPPTSDLKTIGGFNAANARIATPASGTLEFQAQPPLSGLSWNGASLRYLLITT